MARTRRNATARNLYLDIALTLGFLATLKPFLTGIALHELLGLAVGGALVIHGVLHRQWIAAITCRMGCRLPVRTRLCYLTDAALLVGFAVIVVTGVLISQAVLPAVGLFRMPSLSLATLHNAASWTTLGVVALKLALHADWIGHAVHTHLLRLTAARPTMAPARGSVMSRRQFLSLSGATLGTALVFGLWRRWEPAKVWAQGTGEGPDSAVPAAAAVSPTASATAHAPVAATATPQPSVTARPPATTTAGDPALAATGTPVATLTPAPSVTPVPATPTAEAVVRTRCPYGLANDPYPGRCRRYVDSNGSGYCDLSEAA